ncbi:tail assembly protein [Escherichia phage phiLLS]|uniref:Tail assembly protein n=1 Tax=Escherichia phage phiLLS TaxID=1965465 RepID=A0A1V0DZT2_9CAUD|nr:tail assembly protein [Escherichia phage phiLLS]ARB06965.1 tail assembly protein [Escherichia phage phiLLS]
MMEVAITLMVILVWVILIVSRIVYLRLKTLEAQVKQQVTLEKLALLQRCDSTRILQIERELDV